MDEEFDSQCADVDHSSRARLKGRRVHQTTANNSGLFAIYNIDNSSSRPEYAPVSMDGQRTVLSLTWEQFQRLDKKLCSGMSVRIVAP